MAVEQIADRKSPVVAVVVVVVAVESIPAVVVAIVAIAVGALVGSIVVVDTEVVVDIGPVDIDSGTGLDLVVAVVEVVVVVVVDHFEWEDFVDLVVLHDRVVDIAMIDPGSFLANLHWSFRPA